MFKGKKRWRKNYFYLVVYYSWTYWRRNCYEYLYVLWMNGDVREYQSKVLAERVLECISEGDSLNKRNFY
jgi:hypothetical protein